LKSRQVDAFILAGSKYVEKNPEDNQYIIDGAKEHPVMMVNGCIEADGIYSVRSDDKGGMKDAFVQLHESGARKIIYVYSSDSFSGGQKIEGIKAGAKKCGIPEENLRIVKGKKSYGEIAELLAAEYEKEAFDSIIASSDTSGIGAVKFAVSHKLRIPEDIQIVSYNNSKLAEASTPELTSVDAKLEELSKQYGMELEQIKNLVGENEKESMKKDIAIEKAIQLIMDNVKETAKKKATKKADDAETTEAEEKPAKKTTKKSTKKESTEE
jgi:LacI family transcriptional regulator/LacI family asc operon transcriptional repressor